MTIFGIDVSNNNGAGINMAKVRAEGFDFVFAKVSEGDSFVDTTWPHYRDTARAAGLLLAGYHYARSAARPAAQAALFRQYVGDRTIPVMIDFEDGSGNNADYWNLVRAFNNVGMRVALSYLPRWYYNQVMPGADLSAVPGLIASGYPNASGYASVIYYDAAGGDTGFGWQPYGRRTPDLWQFTDRAVVAGAMVDANAYLGTRDALNALLTGVRHTAPCSLCGWARGSG